MASLGHIHNPDMDDMDDTSVERYCTFQYGSKRLIQGSIEEANQTAGLRFLQQVQPCGESDSVHPFSKEV